MEARDKSMFLRKGSIRFEKVEIGSQIFFGVVSVEKRARDKLIKVGAVVVEPRIDIARRPAFIRPINTQTVDCNVRKSLFRQLADV